MADTFPAATAPVVASPTKAPKKAIASKGDDKKPSTHPPVNDMILAAIKTLNERNGSSLQAIKNHLHIAANILCDVAKLAPFVKKALKSGVEKGKLIQTKGTGAQGSFNVKADAKKPAGEKKETKAKKPADKKKVAKKPKASAVKKTDENKAKATLVKPAKKAAGVKKAAASKQKATKPSKTAAKEPKTPKSKKAAPVKKPANRIR
ncbi:histone H1-like [Sabethes cyaneus]|uniref:histone H1-like n=1 Tax=Sabethes cyaneus TaxID=53552 RepID=UPI00237EA667|nr:histone H1-like [Sabethes cyaneus]